MSFDHLSYMREWRKRRREDFFARRHCVDCGSKADLELDHLDPTKKVGSDVWLWAEARQAAELAKCAVRCQSCHRKRHAEEQSRHGPGGYNRGCRCPVCRAASRDRRRDQRARGIK